MAIFLQEKKTMIVSKSQVFIFLDSYISTMLLTLFRAYSRGFLRVKNSSNNPLTMFYSESQLGGIVL
jgi:hypothetical protein